MAGAASTPRSKRVVQERKGRFGPSLVAGKAHKNGKELTQAEYVAALEECKAALLQAAKQEYWSTKRPGGVQFRGHEPWQSDANKAAYRAAEQVLISPEQWDTRAIRYQLSTIHRGQWQKHRRDEKKKRLLEEALAKVKAEKQLDAQGELVERASLKREADEKEKRRARHSSDRTRVHSIHSIHVNTCSMSCMYDMI